jgi:hypothetical protein
MAQAVIRRPLTTKIQVRDRVSPRGIRGRKVALGEALIRLLRISPVNIIPPWLSIPIYRLGDEQ